MRTGIGEKSVGDSVQVFAQLHRAEGFAEIGAYAKLPETGFFIIITGAAHDDHRDVCIHAATLKAGKQLEAIQVGHQSVCHNCVGQKAPAEEAHRFEAILCASHFKMTGKEGTDNLAQTVVVFHEKNLAIHGLDFLIGQ